MYILDQGFKKRAKIACRAGQVLAIVLIWQANHSPVMGQFGSTVQQFPQVVLNGGSTTSFTIHNPSSGNTIDVAVQIYAPKGDALTDQQVELGPGETKTVSFGDATDPLTRGWAELKSEDEFIATEFFQLFLAGLKPRVGVLPSPPAEEIKFLGFVNEQFKSGLAVHNPSPTEATEVTLRLKDNAGQEPTAEKKLTLAPLESEAAFFVNSPPVAVLSLIQEASGDVATVAVETQSHVVTGPTNTALGRGALSSNSTGSRNTAGGAAALKFNTEGGNNTASGFAALSSNTTGSFNTASGHDALFSNTSGNDNTASGAAALSSNSEGIGNTASGNAALVSNTTGSYNTASGAAALFSNTTGINNTASGVNALFFNSTGKDNTAIGHNAGSSLITGDNNIYVGNSGKSEESNTIRIGNSDHTIAFIAGVQVVPPSAKRFKENIHNMDDASGDLMSLRPVTFRYKKDYASGETRLHYGLIAEEVAEVYPELVVNDETGQPRTVEYQKLNVMLLNELQKQSQQIRLLTERLAHLEQEETAEVSEALH